MSSIKIPFERVIQINTYILENEPGMKGVVDVGKLQGALERVTNAMLYESLDDVFEIAAKYASVIANGHALPDANKRTGLAVALEYLSLNDYEIVSENILLAEAMRDIVIGDLTESDFADILYSQYVANSQNNV